MSHTNLETHGPTDDAGQERLRAIDGVHSRLQALQNAVSSVPAQDRTQQLIRDVAPLVAALHSAHEQHGNLGEGDRARKAWVDIERSIVGRLLSPEGTASTEQVLTGIIEAQGQEVEARTDLAQLSAEIRSEHFEDDEKRAIDAYRTLVGVDASDREAAMRRAAQRFLGLDEQGRSPQGPSTSPIAALLETLGIDPRSAVDFFVFLFDIIRDSLSSADQQLFDRRFLRTGQRGTPQAPFPYGTASDTQPPPTPVAPRPPERPTEADPATVRFRGLLTQFCPGGSESVDRMMQLWTPLNPSQRQTVLHALERAMQSPIAPALRRFVEQHITHINPLNEVLPQIVRIVGSLPAQQLLAYLEQPTPATRDALLNAAYAENRAGVVLADRTNAQVLLESLTPAERQTWVPVVRATLPSPAPQPSPSTPRTPERPEDWIRAIDTALQPKLLRLQGQELFGAGASVRITVHGREYTCAFHRQGNNGVLIIGGHTIRIQGRRPQDRNFRDVIPSAARVGVNDLTFEFHPIRVPVLGVLQVEPGVMTREALARALYHVQQDGRFTFQTQRGNTVLLSR